MDARTEFGQLVQQVTSFVGDRDLDAALAADLNDAFGYGSEMHDSLARLIHAGESEGWLLAREAGGWDLVKLEVLWDHVTLYPHMTETLKAAEILIKASLLQPFSLLWRVSVNLKIFSYILSGQKGT